MEDINMQVIEYNVKKYWDTPPAAAMRECLKLFGGYIVYNYIGSESKVTRSFIVYL